MKHLDRSNLAFSSLAHPTSNINVTKRPAQRIHDLPNSTALRCVPHIKHIIKSGRSRLRLVIPCDMAKATAIHLLFGEALGRVQKLPVRPQAVHHTMMHIERRVAGAGIDVSARVTTDDEMAATVGADFDRVWCAFYGEAVRGDVRGGKGGWRLVVVSGMRSREEQRYRLTY